MSINYFDDYTRILKTSNQDVIGTGLTPDTEFFFPVIANNHYIINCDLIISSSNTTADTAFRFQVDSGTMLGKGVYTGTGNTGALANTLLSANNVAQTNTIVCGSQLANINDLVFCRVRFAFTPNTTTNFRLVFGNNTIVAGAISRIWKGSEMWYKNLDI